MELTKEIKYDKKLKQNESVRIDYSGNLFQNGSNDVYIVYGFDKDWKNTTYQKMNKLENCFSTSIQLLEYNDFNFCFKDSNDNWDNNNYSDYTLKIEEKENSTSDLNALLDDILNETQLKTEESTSLEDSISKIQKIADTFDGLFEDIEQTKTSDLTNTEINDIAVHFDSLLDNVVLENPVSNVASVESLDLEKTFPEEFDFSVDTGTIVNIETKEDVTTSTITQIETQTEIPQQSQVTTSSENSNLALVTTSKHKNIFNFENLSPWYVFKKRVRLAFYKLIYVLPAFLFGEEDDSEN